MLYTGTLNIDQIDWNPVLPLCYEEKPQNLPWKKNRK